jgi:hypothetical protein
MPEGRTMEYAIWRSCERFGILPPSVSPTWDKCDIMTQAMILSYDQVRQIEEVKEKAALAGVKF